MRRTTGSRALGLLLALVFLAGVPALAEAAEPSAFSRDYQGIDDAAQSVLMLYWEDAFYAYSGSAFVAFEEDMLLTNYHVIEGAADEIYAYSDSGEEYVIDRVKWLYDHRELVGGLRFVHEPATLRFFTGKLEPVDDWPERLIAAYKAEFGEDQ